MDRLRLIGGGPSSDKRARQGARSREARRSGRRGRQFRSDRPDHPACVVESAYTVGLNPTAGRIKGSNPFTGTKKPDWCNGSTPDSDSGGRGSNPRSGAIPGWCNGSTIGFDPVGRGSKPLPGAIRFRGQAVKAPDCRSGIARSNRAGTSIRRCTQGVEESAPEKRQAGDCAQVRILPSAPYTPLVQLAERRTYNAEVRSSNLRRRTKCAPGPGKPGAPIWENA